MDADDLCVSSELEVDPVGPNDPIDVLPDGAFERDTLLAALARNAQVEEIVRVVSSYAERDAMLAELNRDTVLPVIEREY